MRFLLCLDSKLIENKNKNSASSYKSQPTDTFGEFYNVKALILSNPFSKENKTKKK